MRSEFIFAQSGAEGDGNVTYGEAFTVQPFGNSLVTMTLTGAQIHEMLKEQWCSQDGPRVLLPSAGVHCSWSQAVAGAAVGKDCAAAPNPATGLTIGGTPVDTAASYRITVNSFLAVAATRSPCFARARTVSGATWTPMRSRRISHRRSTAHRLRPRP